MEQPVKRGRGRPKKDKVTLDPRVANFSVPTDAEVAQNQLRVRNKTMRVLKEKAFESFHINLSDKSKLIVEEIVTSILNKVDEEFHLVKK